MDPDKILNGLSKEINLALKTMSKTKDVNEKEAYSRIIKNLCQSQGVYLRLASEMMSFGYDEFEDDEFEDDDIRDQDIPF